jgi:hypothetical protein
MSKTGKKWLPIGGLGKAFLKSQSPQKIVKLMKEEEEEEAVAWYRIKI